MNPQTTNTDILEGQELIIKTIQEVHKKVIGQEGLIKHIIIAMITGGHILLEWVPWVAKTLAIETLSKTLELNCKRVQFTPDLLPSDLIGSQIYNQNTGDFETKKGPIFTNFLLADEINRAPAKVQSALLEAMAEKHITLWEETYTLDTLFTVLATQNPIEQSWTYRLPEAELDRFMMKSSVSYPTQSEEQEILTKLESIEQDEVNQTLSQEQLVHIQQTVQNIHCSKNIILYITSLVNATRQSHKYLSYGASPRWSIALLKAAKAVAFLQKRDFVIPEDVQEMACCVLSHRLVRNYDAIAEDISSESIVSDILKTVEI